MRLTRQHFEFMADEIAPMLPWATGIQELAGNATLLYYLSEEAKEGKNAFMEKREPDFSKFPKFP